MNTIPTARPIQTVPRTKSELPPTYPAGRKCLRCRAELCIYHEAPAELCWPCEPPGEGGVVIRVGPTEWRRFDISAKKATAYERATRERLELVELMEAAA